MLEQLRVVVDKSNKGARVKLGDVAQVVPKGRTVQVVVGEKEVGSFWEIERRGGLANGRL